MKAPLIAETWPTGHEVFLVDFLSLPLSTPPFPPPSRASQVCGSPQGRGTMYRHLERREQLKRLSLDSGLPVSQFPTHGLSDWSLSQEADIVECPHFVLLIYCCAMDFIPRRKCLRIFQFLLTLNGLDYRRLLGETDNYLSIGDQCTVDTITIKSLKEIIICGVFLLMMFSLGQCWQCCGLFRLHFCRWRSFVSLYIVANSVHANYPLCVLFILICWEWKRLHFPCSGNGFPGKIHLCWAIWKRKNVKHLMIKV